MEKENGGLVTGCLTREMKRMNPQRTPMKKLIIALLFLMPGSSPGLTITFDATIPTRIAENTNLVSEVAADISPVVIGLQTNVVDGETLVEQVFKVETNEEKVTRQIAKELQSIIRRMFSSADRTLLQRISAANAEQVDDISVQKRGDP